MATVGMIVGLLVGCTGGRETHREGQGPLSASADVGGTGLYAPSRVPWYGNFGTFFLCIHPTHNADRVVLEAVRYETAPEAPPLEVTPMLRTGGVGRAISSKGQPEGDVHDVIDGAEVTILCDPDEKELELLHLLKSDEAGAHVRSFSIDYRVGRRSYTLEVPWEMVLCGSRVEGEMCENDPKRQAEPD